MYYAEASGPITPAPGGDVFLGRPLHKTEADSNIAYIKQQIVALQSINPGVDIASITQSADRSQITITMSDSTFVTFTLPTIQFNFTNPPSGAWLPVHNYFVNDVFSSNGSFYLVIFAHTSQATFSPSANDGMGHQFYALLFTVPSMALPTGGNADDLPGKIDGTNYNISWRPSGMPRGGNAGYLLLKNSNTDWDASFKAPSALNLSLAQLVGVNIGGGLADGDVLQNNGGIWGNVPLLNLGIVFTDIGGEATPVQVRQSTVTALSSSGSVSVDPTLGDVFTLTPSGAVLLDASSTPAGARISIIITTSGSTSYNVTPSSGFVSQGVLATGTMTGKRFVLDFVSDGTNFYEAPSRTAM